MSRLAVGYVIIAGLAPALLGGQDLRMMRDRLDREAQIVARNAQVLTEYRSPERSYRTATDTFVIADGHLTVLAARDVADVARGAAAQTDSLLRQVRSLLPLVHGAIAYVHIDTTEFRRSRNTDPYVIVRYSLPPHRIATRTDAKIDATDVSRLIEGTTVSRILDRNRTPFFAWRRGNLPLRREDAAREPEWSSVRYEILDSPSLLGPRCYRGDVVACSMMFGFTPVDDPVMAWYDSTTRFTTVSMSLGRAQRFNRAAADACMKFDDAACGRVLHTIHMYETPPAGAGMRDALTWQALRMGGEGAIERLLAGRGSAVETLEAAARAPADSIIREWHRNVREGSLGSEDLSITMVAVAIGWVLLLLFLSTRISRWR